MTGQEERTQTGPAPDSAEQGRDDRRLLAETSELAAVLVAAVQDLARLLRLEARLLVRAAVMMAVLAIFLALVLASAWIVLSAAIAIALNQHAGLGMPTAAAISALLNLAMAIAAGLALKRLARRLTFPETRQALQALWPEAEQQRQ